MKKNIFIHSVQKQELHTQDQKRSKDVGTNYRIITLDTISGIIKNGKKKVERIEEFELWSIRKKEC
jgi:hypothetical protein